MFNHFPQCLRKAMFLFLLMYIWIQNKEKWYLKLRNKLWILSNNSYTDFLIGWYLMILHIHINLFFCTKNNDGKINDIFSFLQNLMICFKNKEIWNCKLLKLGFNYIGYLNHNFQFGGRCGQVFYPLPIKTILMTCIT